ncbi:hypothetical protein ACFL0V_06310, partial [Nanoarchaeota archaeon]
QEINCHDPDGSFRRELGLADTVRAVQADRDRKFPYFGSLEGKQVPVYQKEGEFAKIQIPIK